ncbi:E7 [Procyon lotor papillomavirus 1]|uniref:Protein E7 n=1 Tax=Procyon lotor papillomavirus 1 TaxID=312349 RepID=Q4QW03_9PAPI|nr:E7 [Procyon lotor papillomavirus 1]AAW88322.1 E7 [Procyon lotor papillomavirus 1]
MIGQGSSIGDIVLTEVPEAIDLYCDEHMPSDEEEEEEEPDEREPFGVTVDCGVCKRRVNFVVLSDGEDIRRLQDLLFSLSIVCVSCVESQSFQHGG